MTREEVYKRLREIDTSNFNSSSEVEAYMDGYIDCSKWAVSTMIEKACEWLAANVWQYASLEFLPESDYPQADVEVESLLKAFKQAMKGGDQ